MRRSRREAAKIRKYRRLGRVCYNIIVKPARNACDAVTEFEAATIAFQNATIAHQEATPALQKLTVEFQKDSLALRETSNLIGFIQCGLIAAGLFLVYYFNRTRDRAQTRADTDAQRKHEADARAAQQYREEVEQAAQQHREEAERVARQYREETERRHEESMTALKALIDAGERQHEESMSALKVLIERTAPRAG